MLFIINILLLHNLLYKKKRGGQSDTLHRLAITFRFYFHIRCNIFFIINLTFFYYVFFPLLLLLAHSVQLQLNCYKVKEQYTRIETDSEISRPNSESTWKQRKRQLLPHFFSAFFRFCVFFFFFQFNVWKVSLKTKNILYSRISVFFHF